MDAAGAGECPRDTLVLGSPAAPTRIIDRPMQRDHAAAIRTQIERTEFAWERFHELSADEQATFMRLADSLHHRWTPFLQKAGTDGHLVALLARGTLRDRDGDGVTLLDNLARLATQPMAPGFDSAYMRRQLLEQALTSVADADRIQQGARGTCTATTMEYLHARSFPSDYVRVAAGLLSAEGAVILRNGEAMTRGFGLERSDDSGRCELSRVYQASLMDYANGPLVDYDNATDVNRPTIQSALDLHGLNKGLFPWEVKRALEAITPFRYEAPSFRDVAEERDDLRQRLDASARAGQPTPVILRWTRPQALEFGLHMLLLERVEGDFAYLRNPQGDDEKGDAGLPEMDLPRRESLGGGHIRMPLAEFHDRLHVYFAK